MTKKFKIGRVVIVVVVVVVVVAIIGGRGRGEGGALLNLNIAIWGKKMSEKKKSMKNFASSSTPVEVLHCSVISSSD